MKVINRYQITKVVTERIVSHRLELNGEKYIRTEIQKMVMPHMNCEGYVNEPSIQWDVYTGPNVIRKLSKKEVNTLGLSAKFEAMPISERNEPTKTI